MNRKISVPAVIIPLVVMAAACGGGEEEAAGAAPVATGTDTLVLVLEDTVGLEMGDSAYVFGMIAEAGHGPGGEIVVLDMQRSCLSLYSPEGGFLGNIGSPGPGPGEFQAPVSFAVMSSGGFAVADALAGNISFFGPEGEYTGMMDDFFPAPPMFIEGGPNGSLVGQSMTMVMTDREMRASLEIARWSDSTEADLLYLSVPLDLDLHGGGRATTAGRGPQFDFAVGPEGNVFIAELSDTLFSVRGCSPDGEEFLLMEETVERTPLTQEEIDAGSLSLSIMVTDGEASSEMERVHDVYPWRNVIESLGVDGEGRIWVEMGNTDRPLFRVYDSSGELLFTAVTDVPFTPVTRPTFTVDGGGILACDRDPVDYPKVYTFSMTDRS